MRMSPNATRGASESRRLVRASRVGLLGVTGALPISGSGDIGEAMRGSLSTPPSGRPASPLQAPAAKADGSGALAPLLGRVCLARRYLLERVFPCILEMSEEGGPGGLLALLRLAGNGLRFPFGKT